MMLITERNHFPRKYTSYMSTRGSIYEAWYQITQTFPKSFKQSMLYNAPTVHKPRTPLEESLKAKQRHPLPPLHS